jgi:hypothetical protein
MRVKLSKAVKMFFGNSSLETVYFEAVANALDAGATKIEINISAQDYSMPDTLIIEIKDNGIGFTDERFERFGKLFDVDESSHKGLGRLVYLCYFEKTNISSSYNKYYKRTFEFSDNFEEKSNIEKQDNELESGTKLSMSGYTLTRLANHSFIQPRYLKRRILERFYSRFYKLKQANQQIEIAISAKVDKKSAKETILMSEIPNFQVVPIINHLLDLYANIELCYYIEDNVSMEASTVITAISIDNRTYPLEIIAEENLPIGYRMIFLLYSDYFTGQVDAARDNITLPNIEQVKKVFKDKVAEIIDEKLPQIKQRNNERKEKLINQFPHLTGYFETESIGYTSQNDLLKKAQEKFFRDQREVLGAPHLDDEKFKKSLDLSSRALTEYILFRQITINKLKSFKKNNSEYDTHNLIATRFEKFDKKNFNDDLYRNNVWVLDDKYMTYNTVLSESKMSELIQVITDGEVFEKDNDRPDIAVIFSGNPCDENSNQKIDVVIVELKKKGLSTELNSIVEIQLENRARKLMRYYKNKIQQIWFYGIVEFNEEYELHLEADYHRLYSKGKVYYRNKEIVLQSSPRVSLPAGIFIMDFDAVVEDADARNSTFLNIIKNRLQK